MVQTRQRLGKRVSKRQTGQQTANGPSLELTNFIPSRRSTGSRADTKTSGNHQLQLCPLRRPLRIFAGVVGGLLAFGLIGIFVGPVVLAVADTLLTASIDGDPREDETTEPQQPDGG
jgi:hypothetical protein